MSKLVIVLGVLCAVLVAESSCQRVHIIHPTYRLPPQRPVIIRTAREAPLWLYQDADIPRAPASSDHPSLPSIIDDIKFDPNNRRTARSLPRLDTWKTPPFNPRIPLPDFPTPRPRFPIYARSTRDVEDVEELGVEGARVVRSLSTPRASRGGVARSSSSTSRDTGRTPPGYNRRNARNAPRFPTPFNPRAPNPFPRPDRRSSFPTLARVGRDTEHIVQFDSQEEFLHDDFED